MYLTSIDELDQAEKDRVLGVFEKEIFPVLTPLAVDPGHPFPYISNLSLNLAVLVVDPSTREQRFARVKVPPLLPRFVPLNGGSRFVALEQLIAANLPRLFPHMEIGRHHAFRVTRNADLDLEESEADDLLAAVETELRRRRFGRAVRLEVDQDTPQEVRELLLDELELGVNDVYESSRSPRTRPALGPARDRPAGSPRAALGAHDPGAPRHGRRRTGRPVLGAS